MIGENNVCQSCGMPLNKAGDCGTEKNGDLSQTYCKYCYKDGEFTNPNMTMAGMKSEVRMEMARQNIPHGIVEKAINALPNLKRWKKTSVYS